MWMELGDTWTTVRLTVSMREPNSMSRTRSSVSSPQRSPLSMSVSTSSRHRGSGSASYTR